MNTKKKRKKVVYLSARIIREVEKKLSMEYPPKSFSFYVEELLVNSLGGLKNSEEENVF